MKKLRYNRVVDDGFPIGVVESQNPIARSELNSPLQYFVCAAAAVRQGADEGRREVDVGRLRLLSESLEETPARFLEAPHVDEWNALLAKFIGGLELHCTCLRLAVADLEVYQRAIPKGGLRCGAWSLSR